MSPLSAPLDRRTSKKGVYIRNGQRARNQSVAIETLRTAPYYRKSARARTYSCIIGLLINARLQPYRRYYYLLLANVSALIAPLGPGAVGAVRAASVGVDRFSRRARRGGGERPRGCVGGEPAASDRAPPWLAPPRCCSIKTHTHTIASRRSE